MANSHPTFLVPRGRHARLLPTSGAMMMAAPVPYAFPWPSRTLHGWGRGDSESGIWGCGLCTLPDASRHLLPGAVLACLSCSVCLLQSPLTLSLTQAGLASPATQERKRTRLVGLVSTRLIQPQDALCRGWEYRGLRNRTRVSAGDRDAALLPARLGVLHPPVLLRGPGQQQGPGW